MSVAVGLAALILLSSMACACSGGPPPHGEEPSHTSKAGPPERLPTLYALIWRSAQPDSTFDAAEFDARVPRLKAWLKALHERGHLVACGGGGFESHSGGLTIVNASGPEEAQALARGSPMNEIGSTELLVWDVYFASLLVPREFR